MTKPTTMQRVIPLRADVRRGVPARFRGEFRMYPGGPWCPVVNDAGSAIAYGTAQAARDGASFSGAAWRLAGPPRV